MTAVNESLQESQSITKHDNAVTGEIVRQNRLSELASQPSQAKPNIIDKILCVSINGEPTWLGTLFTKAKGFLHGDTESRTGGSGTKSIVGTDGKGRGVIQVFKEAIKNGVDILTGKAALQEVISYIEEAEAVNTALATRICHLTEQNKLLEKRLKGVEARLDSLYGALPWVIGLGVGTVLAILVVIIRSR